jgi:DNA-binding IclR family transcriptional regulator
MEHSSGVMVLDKVVAILSAAAAEPLPLGDLVERTGISRPTAHRLAVALEGHGLLQRDAAGRFAIGPTVAVLAAAAPDDPLAQAAGPVLRALRDRTGESCQVYRRQGRTRLCVATADRPSGLRDSVPTGARLPMTAGSAAQVLLAWEPPQRLTGLLERASFDESALTRVREQGWAASVAEREAGVASVSAPVRDAAGAVVAAISVSGPIERFGGAPGDVHAESVVAAGRALTTALAPSLL